MGSPITSVEFFIRDIIIFLVEFLDVSYFSS